MESKKLIDTLYFCAAQCTHCYDACLREKEKQNLQRCIKLDEECAEICRLTATRVEKNSENMEKFLRLCAEICETCAAECEKHSHMEHCKKCAEACRTCAEMCAQPVTM